METCKALSSCGVVGSLCLKCQLLDIRFLFIELLLKKPQKNQHHTRCYSEYRTDSAAGDHSHADIQYNSMQYCFFSTLTHVIFDA